MFIREYKTNNKKTGIVYITHRLVEAYRNSEGANLQRIIMHLGTLDLHKSEWRKLAAALEASLSGQLSFLDVDPEISIIAEKAIEHNNFKKSKTLATITRKHNQEIVEVDLQSIATTGSRTLGPELVANNEWERLNFDGILAGCGLNNKEIALSKGVILGRLIEPSSDFKTWEWLTTRSSLLEMLPIDLSKIGKDLVYETADILLSSKSKIEEKLRNQENLLFPSDIKIFLYDLTNTYFEGSALKNDLAHHGKCKSKRMDCPLVTLALVVDSFGFPVFSQIYAGNQSEPETLADILNKIITDQQIILGSSKPTIIMDRGIAITENIALLREKNFNYVIIERRASEKDYIKEFETAKKDFTKIDTCKKSEYGDENHVYIKKIENDEMTCRVLCLSEGRERKEQAIDTKKEERFLCDISKLKKSIEKGNIKDIGKIHERVGRLKEKYSSMAKYYNITIIGDGDSLQAIEVLLERKPIRETRNVLTGCYVIETTHKELVAEEIWNLYMTLTSVEGAFRSLKTDLGLRPVYHQNSTRTQGHLFISVLAYHLLINIERRLRNNGDTRKWETIKKQLSTHQRTTVIFTDKNDVINHIRVSGNPESIHKEIYKMLGVKAFTKRIHEKFGKRL